MSVRTVNGNTFTEDGWPLVDQAGCTWITVPGTTVHLQIQSGVPARVLGAWVADWHAYVEPVYDADSASWTPGNSVLGGFGKNNGSNHLGGSGVDLRWQSHPWKVRNAGLNAAQLATIREMLDWYEGCIWWGGNWPDSYVDPMHSQMGSLSSGDVATYANGDPTPHVLDFINRKIRPDGFSTFRRGGAAAPLPPPPSSGAADVLARATGITIEKSRQILPGVVNGLRDSQCTNVNRIAMWLAQIGHESAGFNATEEYASGADYEGRSGLGNTQPGDGVRFKGRSWIQITGRSNYSALSKWAFGKGVVSTPTFFVDDSTKLSEMQYAGLGPAWYWVVARADINALSDSRDLGAVTQRINGGQNGAADRKNRYDRALALGDQLLTLATNQPASPVQGDDDLSAEAERQIGVMYRELTQQLHSRSPLRHLDDTFTDTMAGYGLNTDAHGHFVRVKDLAALGHPESLALLREVAGAAGDSRYPDRQDDALVAQAILAELASTPVARVANVAEVAATPSVAPQIVYQPVDNSALDAANAEIARLRWQLEATQGTALLHESPAPVVTESPASLGGRIGKFVDSVDGLGLADASDIKERATIAATIAVLGTKNGSQLS